METVRRVCGVVVVVAIVSLSPRVVFAATTSPVSTTARAGGDPAAVVQATSVTTSTTSTPDPRTVESPATALEPQGYTYTPEGRRDPFVSLLRRGSEAQKPALGARPAGLPGLETSEVTLKGTIASQGSFVGILQGSDKKTYIVRAGDRLLDGTIRTITQDSLVVAQQVTDPLSLDTQREVRKALRQNEEAK
jgi:type IV pilus assembly protein PilP